METLLTGGSIYRNGHLEKTDFAVSGGIFVSPDRKGLSVTDISGFVAVPGFTDMHVHFREPGFSYKETISSGTRAAAAGGYTTVCTMPNLNPVPDTPEHLQAELDIIQRDACIQVLPYGAITTGEHGKQVADLEAMAEYTAGFSDDGRGVQSREIMREAMLRAKALGKPIVAHCEDETFLPKGWAVHEGILSRRLGLIGNPPESEWKQVERDLSLVQETGCQYHVCHVSTKESVALIRTAKQQGLPVSCETAPHYLTLCDEELSDDGRFKMNPPVRTQADRDALIAGLLDGTVDCIATDHAPHSIQEKSGGLRNSLNGIIGLETAFPVLYTRLVQTGIVPLETILHALCVRPREILKLPGGNLAEGEPADFTLLNLHDPHVIDSGRFFSQGRSTPFDGWQVTASIAATVYHGRIVYQNPAWGKFYQNPDGEKIV